jgi:transposase-like protein
MVDHIVHTSEPRGRVGARRRRRWSEDVKGQIVTESFLPRAVASEVARRHGLSPQHLSTWRKAARTGLLRLPAETESTPLRVIPPSGPASMGIWPQPPTAVPSGIGRSARSIEELIPHLRAFQGRPTFHLRNDTGMLSLS